MFNKIITKYTLAQKLSTPLYIFLQFIYVIITDSYNMYTVEPAHAVTCM
jgi:hypothetical protein